MVCLDGPRAGAPSFADWLAAADGDPPAEAEPPDEVVALVGTGGTTGRPKGVMLTDRNLEAMSAITLMSYPFEGRPVYLALAPLTHAAGRAVLPGDGARRGDRRDGHARTSGGSSPSSSATTSRTRSCRRR